MLYLDKRQRLLPVSLAKIKLGLCLHNQWLKAQVVHRFCLSHSFLQVGGAARPIATGKGYGSKIPVQPAKIVANPVATRSFKTTQGIEVSTLHLS